MEYTINKLAQMAGVTTRTLRYYDEIGLLVPARTSSNGYRIYGAQQVDRLQQVLFFREMGMPLEEIGRLMAGKQYNGVAALEQHLLTLEARKRQLDTLIATVQQTIVAAKGGTTMSDAAKFEGLKKQMIDENEAQYGAEVRERWGDDTMNESNARFQKMTADEYAAMQALNVEIAEAIKAGVAEGDPASATGRNLAALHKQWLETMGTQYSPEAHIGLGQMYVDDARFAAYYDAIAPGAAVYLRDAIAAYYAGG